MRFRIDMSKSGNLTRLKCSNYVRPYYMVDRSTNSQVRTSSLPWSKISTAPLGDPFDEQTKRIDIFFYHFEWNTPITLLIYSISYM